MATRASSEIEAREDGLRMRLKAAKRFSWAAAAAGWRSASAPWDEAAQSPGLDWTAPRKSKTYFCLGL